MLSNSHLVSANKNSSKGNQLKWKKDNTWYKADYLGYEAFAEFAVSRLLEKTNVSGFVRYNIQNIDYNVRSFVGCISRNFLKENESIITIAKLFDQYFEEDVTKISQFEEVSDRIKYVVDKVVQVTELSEFGKYLTFLLEMDEFFQNEDRHFNNIAVIRNNETKEFSYCPIFDNGASLFSDVTISFPIEMDVETCKKEIDAKPFSNHFNEQVEAAESLYGVQFKYWFTKSDIYNIVDEVSKTGMYSKEIENRVRSLLIEQLGLFKCYESFHKEEPLQLEDSNRDIIERI